MIDGNNLLGFSDYNEVQLTRLLSAYCESHKLQAELFYDGYRPDIKTDYRLGKLHVMYSGTCSSADEQILKATVKIREPRIWSLYTNDRELAGRVGWTGIKVRRVEELLKQLKGFGKTGEKSEAKPAHEFETDRLVEGFLISNHEEKSQQ